MIAVHGAREDAVALRDQVAELLAPMGLLLSQAKTRITHIDEGLVFLGYRIQRHRKRGTNKLYVYTYPSKTAVAAVKAKVKTCSRQACDLPLADLLRRINSVLRGWTQYFRHGSSKTTFGYLRHYSWARVIRWLRRKHPRVNWEQLRRRYLPGWRPTDGNVTLFDPAAVTIRYYRYRGRNIPSPWPLVSTPA